MNNGNKVGKFARGLADDKEVFCYIGGITIGELLGHRLAAKDPQILNFYPAVFRNKVEHVIPGHIPTCDNCQNMHRLMADFIQDGGKA